MKERKPGTVREGRIPIYDYNGHVRGHVGPNATNATVARFIGRHGAKLGKRDGRDAWIGPKPPPLPSKAPPTPKPASMAPQKHSLEISLKTDKGSVGKGDMKRRS